MTSSESTVQRPPLAARESRAPVPRAAVAPTETAALPEALVVVPGGVNYFYDQAGRRIAEALAQLGCRAAIHTLRTVPDAEFDACFLVNLYELGVGYGQEEVALQRVKNVRRRCRRTFAVALDCVKTHWFSQTLELCRRAGVTTLLDFGFLDQSPDLPRDARSIYRFVFNGMTDGERGALESLRPSADDRPLPWAVIGHASPSRVELVERLVREVDPAGFVYLPRLVPVTQDGPHLNEEQFQRVLRRTRFQIWRSHHDHFYMESERFRMSALAGCVPVKLVRAWEQADPSLPFRALLIDEEEAAARLRELHFEHAWEQVRDEFLARPTLEEGLSELLARTRVRRIAAVPVPEIDHPHHRPQEKLPAGVTIGVPNWNHEYVLPRALDSALRAVRSLRRHGVPADVLVVDDGSRDGSLTLLRQLEALHYADGLRVLALAHNIGLPAVRNRLLREAAHPYVAFMDADNELIGENLFHFARAMAQTGAAAVYGNLIRRGADGQLTAISNESFQDRMVDENYIDAFALFDRRQVLDAGGYSTSENVQAREDWELYLHLAASGRKIAFVPMVFGVYHELPSSMIQQANDSHPAQKGHVRRAFDQLGVRRHLPMNARHLRYHPDLGML
jgi:hypothetical protein